MKTVVKREKGRVDLFGERFRARAHQLSPRLLAVVSYINENREAVLERTAMEIASATNTSDATVVRAMKDPNQKRDAYQPASRIESQMEAKVINRNARAVLRVPGR